jgi:DNA modification methylase
VEPFELYQGDCLEVMQDLEENSIDSIVTDPPYELGFMGKSWDSTGVAYNVPMWAECLRVLKPGGHLLSFGGSRTYHRMTCAIEDAGFQIRDQIMWLYGSGFPKSLDVSKAIDKAAGAERVCTREGEIKRDGYGGDWDTGSSSKRPRYDTASTGTAKQWQGWGTALKPAHEPICVARKPLVGTVAANVLEYGTGALNIDGCRVGMGENDNPGHWTHKREIGDGNIFQGGGRTEQDFGSVNPMGGRWPANVIHDGSDEVLDEFAKTGISTRVDNQKECISGGTAIWGDGGNKTQTTRPVDNDGSAARFFYCAKTNKKDRGEGNGHPTVKPTDLMRYLVRLVTPLGGTVLDPFMGSGSTGKAAMLEGFNFVGIDQNNEYMAIAYKRITEAFNRYAIKESA